MAVVDLERFLAGHDPEACALVCNLLEEQGVLAVRDPRVDFEANAKFRESMEAYFQLPLEAKMKDAHPDSAYQVR